MDHSRQKLEKFAVFLKLDRGLSPRTVEAYSTDVAGFLEGFGGELSAVDRRHVEKRLAVFSKAGIGKRSLARKLSALRLFFKFAEAEGWCSTDPVAGIKSGAQSRPLPKTMTAVDVEALMAASAADSLNAALLIRVLYAAGLRVSELIGLEPGHLDLGAGVIRVRGKGQKTRIVPVDPDTVSLLSGYLKDVRPALEAQAGGKHPREFFLSRLGRAYTRQGVWKIIKRCAMAAGLNGDLSPHVLRHAFATHLLERGMNLRSLQMILGHSDISTTEIYTHLSVGHLDAELRKHHPKGKA